jgi:hypothetical protein
MDSVARELGFHTAVVIHHCRIVVQIDQPIIRRPDVVHADLVCSNPDLEPIWLGVSR